MKCKRILKVSVFALIFILIFYSISGVLKRKAINGAWNFSIKTGGFYNLEEDSLDIMAIGSSHCYCGYNPIVMWNEKSVKSYVLSSQQQPIKASYYYIKEALKTQQPQVIMLDAYMAGIDMTNPEEGVVRDAYEYFEPSLNKLEMIHDLAPKENYLEYYFSLFKYHSRWSEITVEDFNREYKSKIDEYRGYVYLTDSTPQSKPESYETQEIDYITGENLEYLNRIVELSKEYNFQLVLWYAPYIIDEENLARLNGIKNFAEKNSIVFINTLNMMDKLDMEQDFYETGHVNYRGSEKVTKYLAKSLFEKCSINIENSDEQMEEWDTLSENYKAQNE